MGTLFDTYEEEFLELKTNFGDLLKTIKNPSTYHDDKKETLSQANNVISESEELLNSMKLSANTGSNKKLISKCAEYEKEVKHMKQELRNVESEIQEKEDRDSLFSGGRRKTELIEGNADHKASLLRDTEKAKKTSTMLKDAKKEVFETMDIADDALRRLDEQNSMMERMKERVREINAGLGTAKRTIGQIQRRVMTNKLIFGLIAFFLFCAIIGVIWWRYVRDPNAESTPTTSTPPPATSAAAAAFRISPLTTER
eukprot:TRINITY_DN1435_c0_g1_i1.p1 TRINITY_DN1435_c0_g1~~TRINITY_DN1435_c0_g1_i1.p1  ORF type:complete len:280 (-),score=107.67 TRINITY_DN1435_c0_g1_i1:31-798(-)